MKATAFGARWCACGLWLMVAVSAAGQAAKDLPMPTRYVNDYAHVLSPETIKQIEAQCRALHKQAKADIAMVTLDHLAEGETVEEFTVALEEKWKLGKKGSDRSAIFVIVMNPHKIRIETGYGLEAVLPDTMDGRIRNEVAPYAHARNFDDAAKTGINEMAAAVAADAHVTLDPTPIAEYHTDDPPVTDPALPASQTSGSSSGFG